MKKIYKILCISLISALVVNCQRRPLEDEIGDLAFVPIHIDWSQSGLDVSTIKRASVWFYPQDGRMPVVEPLEESLTDAQVTLPEGVYSVIVFNGYVDEDGSPLLFSDMERFETASVSTKEDKSPFAKFCTSRADGDSQPVRKTPEAIASWSLNQFEVTWDMVVLTRTRASGGTRASGHELTRTQEAQVDKALEALQHITPLPLTYNVTVDAYVHRLSSAALAGARLLGATGKILLSTGQPVLDDVVMHPINFEIVDGKDVIWDDPVAPNPGEDPVLMNGTLHKSFRIFHHRATPDYELDLTFTLKDKTTQSTPKIEVTDQVNKDQPEIKVEIGTKDPNPEPDPGTPEIDKPIILPPIIPVEVGGWGEGGTIDIL